MHITRRRSHHRKDIHPDVLRGLRIHAGPFHLLENDLTIPGVAEKLERG